MATAAEGGAAAEARKAEQRQMADFLDSPVWLWLVDRLQREQRALIVLAARTGLSSEDRALIVGRLSVVAEVISRPDRILHVAEETEKQLPAYKRAAAPKGAGALV